MVILAVCLEVRLCSILLQDMCISRLLSLLSPSACSLARAMPPERFPTGSLQKLLCLASSILHKRFNCSKCKTEANLVSTRIKLLRNRRETQVRQMRRDISMLLQSFQEDTARIWVEHIIREQNIIIVNEVIHLFVILLRSVFQSFKIKGVAARFMEDWAEQNGLIRQTGSSDVAASGNDIKRHSFPRRVSNIIPLVHENLNKLK